MIRPTILATLAAGSLAFGAGCQAVPPAPERTVRDHLAAVGRELPPTRGQLPLLGAESPPGDYVHFALLKHPAVFAAYSDWRAAVESIAPARALPDPQITFQADIAGTVMSLMPGVMFDLMVPGKRAAMAREAIAGSDVAYRQYLATVIRTAANVRKAWIELAFIEEMVRLREASLTALSQSVDIAAAEYSTGRGMTTLESQIRASGDTDRIRSEIAALADRLQAARVQFKSALGLAPADPDPFWPRFPLVPTVLLTEEELWRRVQSANPDLAKMRAMVEMAVADEAVAHQSRIPDFTAGLMADVKQAPWMWRPTTTVTLPVWRGKIAGQLAAAQARREAAVANVDAERLTMAAELARMLYMVREADRMIVYIDATALPNLDRTVASAEAAIQSGMGASGMIPEARLMASNMRIERLNALRERELAVTELLLMTAQVATGAGSLLPETALSSHP
jgi:outer membrane protein TolC